MSVLDLATAGGGVTPRDALLGSAELARHAERWGYGRYWFSEHHNMPSIVSSTPAVLAGFIASHTERIRVGSGGVMLPNHSPLVIAEQYGTLATLYPGRVDLGLGRAPGTDFETVQAMRRSPDASERFPQDVQELQRLLGPARPGATVRAIPGEGTEVPLYILGSSLFGAGLAAHLGLPYAFASHFAPAELLNAARLYRAEFRPSEALEEPYMIASMNVFAADTDDEAQLLHATALEKMARALSGRSVDRSDRAETEAILRSPVGRHAQQMLHFSAVGDADAAAQQVSAFAEASGADEVMVAMNVADLSARIRSYELLASVLVQDEAQTVVGGAAAD
ncbi:MAG: LLM class flavin-dependent oxidoreductase [Patulibacter sp.]|nr:LLM class flavin-dependent oxidoreductase [Patulibacter sp.]MDO9407587.1 LLM class flavin-dependent oxidoreductase [Patulibacter sp.]